MSRLARFAAIQGHSMLTVSAARRRLPSPVGLPLAGFLRRAQRGLPCEVQHDPLEINAAAFRDGDKAALLIAIDTLIAGPDLTAAADALAQECFGPGTVALVAASHPHFAPATDRTRPMLGEIAPAYVAAVHAALRQVIVELRAAQTGPSVGLASCAANANVHRRRRWPFPTLLWSETSTAISPQSRSAALAVTRSMAISQLLAFTRARDRTARGTSRQREALASRAV